MSGFANVERVHAIEPKPSTAFSSVDGIIGRSAALRTVMTQIDRAAPTDVTILIQGETGTGKELLAKAVHWRSRRFARPFIATNLAAVPDGLIASELFGYEAGAFTGATQKRIGRLEAADRGTLFLDEVGELPPDVQVTLLRVLQERSIERLGSSQTRRIDVRFVAATNRPLNEAVETGVFRLDLYYRLSVFAVRLPPLRERRDDIPLLAAHFTSAAARRLCRRFDRIDDESMRRLRSYEWPGNIRELENVIEHSAIVSDGPVLHVPADLLMEKPALNAGGSLATVLAQNERDLIERTLAEARGRVSGPNGAAVKLGVPGSTLESKIKRLGIDKLRSRRMTI